MAILIGPKLQIEGDQQYRNSINQIITQAKTLSSEMRTVESSFTSETTAKEKAAAKSQLLNKQIANMKQLVAENTDQLARATEKYGENDQKTLKWKQAVNNATTELNKLEAELAATEKAADEYGNEVEDADKKQDNFTNATKRMEALEQASQYLQKAADKFKEFAKAAVDSAKELDVGYDTIVKKTGATGDALDELNGIADDLFSSMPTTMEDAGKAVGEVNTRLGLTGDELKSASERFLQFARINDVDVSTAVDTVQKALSAYGLEAKDTGRILDVMTAAGQASGVGMNELASAMVKNAGALSELGLSAEQSIMFIGRLEKSGVDSETALTGMSRALKNATKQGIPFDQALADLEDTIKNGTGSMDGLSAAYDLFGRSGDKIYNAVKTGSVSFKDLTGSVKDYSGTVTRTYEATLSPWDKTRVAMNNLKKVGSELAGNALSTLAPAIDKLTGLVKKAADWFANLSPAGKTVAGVLTAVGGAALIAGPKILAVVKAVEAFKIAQMVSKGVDALTASQVANAAGAKGAAAATELFNGALLANPAVAIAAAIAGLTIGLTALIVHFGTGTSATSEFNNELRQTLSDAASARKGLDEAVAGADKLADSASKSMSETEAAATLAGRYGDELIALANNTSRTSEEQSRMEALVAELNTVYPELGLAIDETTGNLNMSTEALEKNIKAMQAQAKMAAYQEILQEYIESRVEIEKELIQVEQEQEAVQKKNAEAADRLGKVQQGVSAQTDSVATAQEKYNRALQSGDVSAADQAYMELEQAINSANSGMVTINGSTQNVNQSMNDYATAAADTADEMQKLDSSHTNATAKSEELGTKIQETQDQMKAYAEELGLSEEELRQFGLITDETETQVDGFGEAVQTEAEEVKTALQEMQESAHKSIDSTLQGFEEFNAGTATSADQIAANLQSQIDGVTNWQKNLDTLLIMGGDSVRGMVEDLYAQGPQTAAAVQALVDGGAEKLAEIAEKWNKREEIAQIGNVEAQALEAALGVVSSSAQTGMDQVEGALTTGASEATNAAANQLQNGGGQIDAAAGQVGANAGAEVAESTASSIQGNSGVVNSAVTDMLSSGKGGEIAAEAVGTAIGRALGRGLISTQNQIKGNATSVMTSLKNGLKAQEGSSKTQAQNAGRTVATALAGGLNSGRSQVQSAAQQLGSSVSSVVTGVNAQAGSARSAGSNLGSQLASGIRSSSGTVSSAAGSLKTAASNQLSSNNAYEWGKHLGDNFANGINAARQSAINAAKATADAVARILKHSTPKEGPLKDDDVWGLHLGENLADGMRAAIPGVRGAATSMAKAAATVNDNIPVMMLGADDISGRSAASSSTAYNYGGFTVVVNGAPGQDVNELADVVMGKINAMVERKAAAIA